MSPDLSTLAGRLRWAIEEHQPRRGRQRGLRLFQRKMEKRAEAPHSLSAIQAYLLPDESKRVEPPLSFLRVASEVLGVREAWLAYGEGMPTEEEEKEALALRLAGEAPPEDLRKALEAGLGTRIPSAAVIPLFHIWRRLHWAGIEGLPDDEELAELIGAALIGPLQRFGGTLESRDPDFVAEYVFASLPALSVALRALGLGGTEGIHFTPEERS